MLIFYFLVMLMPLEQHPLWGKFVAGGTVIKWVGLVCVIYAIFNIATRGTPHRYFSTAQSRIFLVYLLLVSASYWTMGSTFSLHFSVFLIYVSMALLFFVVLGILGSLERLRWTLLTAIGSIGLTSLYVFREWMKHPMWRPGSISGDANYFTLNAALVLPLALLWMFRSKVLWERFFALGCVVITILSTTLGASRGGLLALLASFLWLIWHSPRRTRNLIAISILFVPPLLLLPSSPLQRALHPKYSDLAGKKDRLIAWKAGLRMIKAHPVTGIGLGQFKPEMLEYADPGVRFSSIGHNTYLEIAAEAGLPTLAVFLSLVFFTYRGFGKARRRSESGPPLVHLAALGLQAGFVGYVVGAFFLSAEYQKMFWLWIFLSMCMAYFSSMPSPESGVASRYTSVTGKIPRGWSRQQNRPGWRAPLPAPSPQNAELVGVKGYKGVSRDRKPGS